MLLFSRVVTLEGSPRELMGWSSKITEYVNEHSALELTCWSASFGYPIGTVAWSAVVESQAAFVAATATLLADDGYHDLLEGARDMANAPGQDLLRELIHGTPGEPPPLGAVATITTATAAVDRLADALSWAVEMAEYAGSVMDGSIAVLSDVFGTMGGITWISVQPELEAAEAARGKLRADPGYIGKMVATKDVFLPGSGHVSQVTRIA
jgi:hypothetical protein